VASFFVSVLSKGVPAIRTQRRSAAGGEPTAPLTRQHSCVMIAVATHCLLDTSGDLRIQLQVSETGDAVRQLLRIPNATSGNRENRLNVLIERFGKSNQVITNAVNSSKFMSANV
jgi:hypothetical protein